MSSATIFLGRLIGLYLIVIALGMLMNRTRTLAAFDDMARSGSWMLFSGMAATAAGLAIVVGHNVWSGGALPVVVTLAGWAALLKGIALLLIPGARIADGYRSIGFERFFVAWMIAVLALGLWVTAMAFGMSISTPRP